MKKYSSVDALLLTLRNILEYFFRRTTCILRKSQTKIIPNFPEIVNLNASKSQSKYYETVIKSSFYILPKILD